VQGGVTTDRCIEVKPRGSAPRGLAGVQDRHLVAIFYAASAAVVLGTVLVVLPRLHDLSTVIFIAGLIVLAGAFVTLGIKRSAIPISVGMAITVLVAAALALAPASVPGWIVAGPAVVLVALLVRARGQLW